MFFWYFVCYFDGLPYFHIDIQFLIYLSAINFKDLIINMTLLLELTLVEKKRSLWQLATLK